MSPLLQLNLSDNRLCGVWLEHDYWGKQMGTYSAKGIKAVADALRVNGSLTAADLRASHLDAMAKQLLRDAVKDRRNFDLKL